MGEFRWPLAASALLVVVVLASCAKGVAEERGAPPGGETVTLRASDGVMLTGHYWDRGSDRLVLYLHEFREGADSWWEHAQDPGPVGASALTLDFRGHGDSEGSGDDLVGMLLDAEAAYEFARAHGYRQVMLVGAGMGASVAILAAHQWPAVTVVGFSAPAEFDTLAAVEGVAAIEERLRLFATRDDVSAADSLRKFRSLGGLDAEEARIYPGQAHGVRMLEGRNGADLRAVFEELLAEFWLEPGA